MHGTQYKLYRRGIEKYGEGGRIKKGRFGEREILCSLVIMRKTFSYSQIKLSGHCKVTLLIGGARI